MTKPTKKRIRVLALGIFYHHGKILVFKGHDREKNEDFYRPLGGAIEFGETAAEALSREIIEEISAEICNIRYLGMFENIFTFENQLGHEIILMHDAEFVDPDVYTREHIRVNEDDWLELDATWLELKSVDPNGIPLYPEGLKEMLEFTYQEK
jgi:ADP-ribose pyrophosphatase YjhB (NUDIX family)